MLYRCLVPIYFTVFNEAQRKVVTKEGLTRIIDALTMFSICGAKASKVTAGGFTALKWCCGCVSRFMFQLLLGAHCAHVRRRPKAKARNWNISRPLQARQVSRMNG
jgi:hypothetical protein